MGLEVGRVGDICIWNRDDKDLGARLFADAAALWLAEFHFDFSIRDMHFSDRAWWQACAVLQAHTPR